MRILDTDHMSLLERGGGMALTLQMRLDPLPETEIATTIVTYEEQMRGWLSRAAQADTLVKTQAAYTRLISHIETFQNIIILPFDSAAAAEYDRLRQMRIRIGTMDMRIAAIALANNATLLTRNLGDFGKVPGLRAEDWSV